MQKHRFYFLLLVLIVLIGINSCTVKKRLYQPGYYVEWNKANKDSKHRPVIAESESNQKEKRNETVTKAQNCNSENICLSENAPDDETVFASNDLSNHNLEIVYSQSQNHIIKISSEKLVLGFYGSVKREKPNDSKKDTEKTGKIHWMAIAGPSTIVLHGLVYLITFVFRFPFPPILWLVTLAGLVISIIALVEIINHPETYRGKIYAILGIALNPITLFLLGITLGIIIQMYI
ncbi:MAG TPA: DUF4190 domain-containing protein [Bacteroidales bacterium]|nr:DUF4190 domain-containing protein [Bacteroidales bacterium]